MKIMFINKFLDKHSIYRVPLGILYLSSTIKKEGHQVFIAEPTRENIFKKMQEIKPNVVAYSLRTGFHRYYIELNKKLKRQFNYFSVFGGSHPTFFPEMIEEEGVDCIGRGECELAIVNLLNLLRENRPYHKTKNFWFKIDGQIFQNPLEKLEQNLDSLPFPDRDLLNGFKEIGFSRIRNFIASRGCPYDCTYCFNHKLKEMYADNKYVRRRSVDNVVEEIKQVITDYRLTRVHFEDDTFNINKEWLGEFVVKYPKIPFKCNIRADLVDEETIKLLKEANCISVTFGIEAGNDRIRNGILNRHTSKEQIINCAQLLRKYKIKFITENMLANPTSTLSDDIETLDLNLICKPDYPIVSFLQPYPRTEILKIASKNNEYTPKNIEGIKSFYTTSPLKISHKIERTNLQRIFALVTAFPFLRRYVNFLIRQKIGFIYTFLYAVWRPYCLVFKIMPHKISFKEFLRLIYCYLTN